jgi:hypothetical protein
MKRGKGDLIFILLLNRIKDFKVVDSYKTAMRVTIKLIFIYNNFYTYYIVKESIIEGRNDDERLLSAHVKSSHTSTKVHGRYCSAEARCALMPNRKLSLLLNLLMMLLLLLFANP